MNRLVISCTGYDLDDREIMIKFIQDNDGEYSPKLSEKCTHLIIELVDIVDSGMYVYLHM